MEYVIAVYRSRNVTMQAYDYLVNNGVTAALVSTPRGANVGCGLSVKLPHGALSMVQSVLSRHETFVGFFLVKNTASGTIVTRL